MSGKEIASGTTPGGGLGKQIALPWMITVIMLATLACGPAIRTELGIPTGRLLPLIYNADSLRSDARAVLQMGDPDLAALLATNAIARQPLDQESLVILQTALTRTAGHRSTHQIAKGLELLPRLGWRNNDAMMLLYGEAVRPGQPDYPAATLYADSMLRREQMTNQLFPMLNELEQRDRSRGAMARLLARRPKWRLQYFASVAKLPPHALLATAATVHGLLDSGERMDDREVSVLLNGLARQGQLHRAYRLWSAHRQRPPSAPIVWDGSFDYATDSTTEDWQRPPFEWKLGRESQFTLRVDEDHRQGLNVRWSGKGRPVFARQQVYVPPGMYRFELAMRVARGSIDRLAVSLRCVRGRPMDFALGLTSEGRWVSGPFRIDWLGCNFPFLEVGGRPGRPGDTADITIQKIYMKPLHH